MRDVLSIELPGDRSKTDMGGPPLMDLAHDRRSGQVNNQMVLIRWILLVAIGGIAANIFSLLAFGCQGGIGFTGNILDIVIVDDIFRAAVNSSEDWRMAES